MSTTSATVSQVVQITKNERMHNGAQIFEKKAIKTKKMSERLLQILEIWKNKTRKAIIETGVRMSRGCTEYERTEKEYSTIVF